MSNRMGEVISPCGTPFEDNVAGVSPNCTEILLWMN